MGHMIEKTDKQCLRDLIDGNRRDLLHVLTAYEENTEYPNHPKTVATNAPYSLMDVPEDENEKVSQWMPREVSGSIILSLLAVPNANTIVQEVEGIGRTLVMENLKDFLQFLELIVLHEKIVIANPPLRSHTEETLIESTKKPWSGVLRQKGILDLDEYVFDNLRKANILGYIYTEGCTEKLLSFPEENVAYYVPRSERLRSHCNWMTNLYAAHLGDKEAADAIAKADLARLFGRASAIAQMSMDFRLPFLVGPVESYYLSEIESLDSQLTRSAIQHLKKSLDHSMHEFAVRIDQLGFETVFPNTPIAMQILMGSIVPEDMVDTTLSLRDRYAPIRAAMTEIDLALRNDETTVARKQALCRELKKLTEELSPNITSFVQRATVESIDMLSVASKIADVDPVIGISRLIAKLLKQPIGSIGSALRRRRIRAMLRSRTSCLGAKDVHEKLSTMFELSRQSVSSAYARANDNQPQFDGCRVVFGTRSSAKIAIADWQRDEEHNVQIISPLRC
jgi:hypothetical protein